jgi:hypothetical protein
MQTATPPGPGRGMHALHRRYPKGEPGAPACMVPWLMFQCRLSPLSSSQGVARLGAGFCEREYYSVGVRALHARRCVSVVRLLLPLQLMAKVATAAGLDTSTRKLAAELLTTYSESAPGACRGSVVVPCCVALGWVRLG